MARFLEKARFENFTFPDWDSSGLPNGNRDGMDNDRAQTLVREIAAGSEAALTEFYKAFEKRVYAFSVSRLHDPHDATDVLNQVMLEVWRTAWRFEGRSTVSTWVLGITHHKVMTQFRRQGHREMVELDPGLIAETGATIDEILDQAQEAERLRRCVESLSDAHRQVVHLAFYEDLSYREIAKIVDCPEGTVKTRAFHAKKALKRCLAGEGNRGPVH